MNFLKRELAPLSQDSWTGIDERATRVLKSILSIRKFAKYTGPKGYDFKAIATGRLALTKDKNPHYGINIMLPLVEARVNFVLNRWEMDNINRGALDIDYKPLEDALLKAVEMEEKAVYYGLEDANIQGLLNSTSHEHMALGDTPEDILKNISKGVLALRNSYSGESPFSLVVSEEIYTKISSVGLGYNFVEEIKEILRGGNIISSKFLQGAVLVPHDCDDIELTIGQDYSIGYQEHNETEVKLFVTLSFTFRITDNTLVIVYDR